MKARQVIGLVMAIILVALIAGITMRATLSSLAAVRKVPALTATPTTATLVDRSVTPETVPDDMGTPELIPPCEFEVQAQPMSSDSSLDAYVFSEPEVVLTSTTAIRLFQWLPDGHTWLIGRAMTGRAGEYIETFDLVTGEIKRYAERRSSAGKPIWLSSEQAVAFVDSMPPDYTKVLYLARGEDSPVEELATDLASSLLSLSPDGRSVVYFSNTQGMQFLELRQATVPGSPATGWTGRAIAGRVYGGVWRADGQKVAMYGKDGLYLVDQVTGAMCEIDLGRVGAGEYSKVRASNVTWSTDGRYLAMLTSYGNPVQFLSLKIVDTLTGKLYDVEFDGRFAYSIGWSPSNNILLTTIDANPDPSLGSFDSLCLVDAATYSVRPILPEHQFFAAGYFGALWSPDGKTVGVACSDVVPPDEVIEWRVCTTSVEMQR